MKKRLTTMILFCMVIFVGCSTPADGDVDDISQVVCKDNSLEHPLQEASGDSAVMHQKTSQACRR